MNIATTTRSFAAVAAAGLCLLAAASSAACGSEAGADTLSPTPPAQTQPPGQPTTKPDTGGASDKARDIHDALLKSTFSSPKGFAGPKNKDFPVSNDQKKAGAESAVQVTFSVPTGANVIYYIFATADQASRFEAQVRGALPGGPAGRKFLPYLTEADCAETFDGGTCALPTGQVVIVATAATVDSGAASLLLAGKAMVDGGAATPPKPTAMPIPCGPTNSATASCQPPADACALMTVSEAASFMHGAVGGPSRDQSGNCTYPSTVVAGDSLSVQPQSEGSSQFDHALSIAISPQTLAGVGDKAFLTISRGMPMAQVHILKGGRYVIVFLINSRDSALDKSAIEAAKTVASRIH